MLVSIKEDCAKHFIKMQACPDFINIIMENNQSHKSGENSALYNVPMKVSPLSPCVCILTSPVCFGVT